MQKDILCFQVSVINVLFVKIFAAISKLDNEGKGFFLWKGAFVT